MTTTAPTWEIKLLYDGQCPICLHEVNFLRQRDGDHSRLAFVDIMADDYDPADHGGVSFEAAMGRIHAVRADGEILKNVEVFRQIYAVIGLGWVYAATRWPIIGPVVDWLYGLWAMLRLPITGRPSLRQIVAEREAKLCDRDYLKMCKEDSHYKASPSRVTEGNGGR
ncbi:thiol-disulfide oxidoreductase DCC family protein, partial [Spirulina sp.]